MSQKLSTKSSKFISYWIAIFKIWEQGIPEIYCKRQSHSNVGFFFKMLNRTMFGVNPSSTIKNCFGTETNIDKLNIWVKRSKKFKKGF